MPEWEPVVACWGQVRRRVTTAAVWGGSVWKKVVYPPKRRRFEL